MGNRRSHRSGFFQDRDVSHMTIRVRGLEGVYADQRLTAYLQHANLRFSALDDAVDTVAKIARFSDLTMVHVRIPRGEVVWPRDLLSLGRAAVIMIRHGEVAVEGDGVFRREPGIVVVPPGESRVAVSLIAPVNELIYVSVPSALIADIPLSASASAARRETIEAELLEPFGRIMAGLARATAGEEGARSVRFAAGEIVRALLHLAAHEPAAGLTLFEQAIEAIEGRLSDPSLNANTLAPELGVSPRRLQLEFQRRGTTVQRELRRLRVAAVLQVRRENPDADMVLLARAFGFGSKSALYRALAENPDRVATA